MKEVIEKTKLTHSNFPEKLTVNAKNILDRKDLVNQLNNLFIKVGPKLEGKMQPSKYYSKSLIDSINSKLLEKTVSINELSPTKVRELKT